MGMYEVKTKLLTLISNADSTLQPQATHVLGNWKTNIAKLPDSSFPVVTVRITNAAQIDAWGFRTPTKAYGEYYHYRFTAFVFSDTLTNTRELADKIIDYLLQNNKHVDVGIMDITEVTSREASSRARRKRKIEITGLIIVEESLT